MCITHFICSKISCKKFFSHHKISLLIPEIFGKYKNMQSKTQKLSRSEKYEYLFAQFYIVL